jgi:hypothetical protein
MTLFRRKPRSVREPEFAIPDPLTHDICGFALHEMERLAAERTANTIPKPVEPSGVGGDPEVT